MTTRAVRCVTTTLSAFALSILLAPANAVAQQPARWAAWQLQWENDALAAFSGSDEHYTNGIRFSWIRNPDRRAVPAWIADAGERWCGVTRLCGPLAGALSVNLGHSISQTFYTPEDITAAPLIVGDRPYAGYLHFGTQVFLRNDSDVDDWRRNRPIQNYFELQLGFIGPATGAEWLQTEVHKLIDDDLPQGWDNQLHTEPTVQAIYLWRRKLGTSNLDFIPHWGAGLGNVMIYANAGATARFGWNLSDFPVLTIAPTATPVDLNVADWELYGFLGAAGRGVAHNIFLDGNTFRDSHSVNKESWVYDLKAGFVARYKKCRLSYTFVRRSREFSPTFDDDGGRHDYGSVAFTYLTTWKPSGR